jgi:preprotein translocase subunit YajC
MLLTVDLLFAAAKATKSGLSPIFLVIIVVYAGAYFFYFRPRQKRAKAARSEGRSFNVGDRVVTIGQMVGTVVSMDGDLVTLSTPGGAELQFLTRAIASKYVEPTVVADDEAHDTTTHDDDASGDQH